jgi:hypothetical protein
MAALNARQVAAGVVGLALAFGVCSCTTQNPTSPGGTVPVSSATISPTDGPTPTPDVSIPDVTIDPSTPAYDGTLPAWWDGNKPTSGAWSEGYQFSEQPQTAAEVAIQTAHPDLWAMGVRDTAESTDPRLPLILVQYYNGGRYEGTPAMPLLFGDRDPMMQPPTSLIQAIISDPYSAGNTPRWNVRLSTTSQDRGIEDTIFTVCLQTFAYGETKLMTFHGLTKALNYVQGGNDLTTQDSPTRAAGESRVLYPGEPVISVLYGEQTGVYDPSTGQVLWTVIP